MGKNKEKKSPFWITGVVAGLSGLAIGVCVALSDVAESLKFFANVRWLPYVLGGISVAAVILDVFQDGKLKRLLPVFLLGVGAIAIVPLFWYAVAAVVVCAVGGYLISEYTDWF